MTKECIFHCFAAVEVALPIAHYNHRLKGPNFFLSDVKYKEEGFHSPA